MNQADIPLAELSDSLNRNDLVLFIGAGLSIGAGLPGWHSLIQPLAQSVGYQLPAESHLVTADSFLAAAQYYENQRGRHALIQRLRDTLDTTGVQPTPVHRLLAALPVKVIFTTNYDDLIERALRDAGRRYQAVVGEAELALWSEDRVQVVKLCGDQGRPESIILTKRDFSTYFATRPRLAERLRTTLEVKTALFLGYSLQDPFFNQLWDHIGLDFGTLRRRGYAVLFDANPLEADDLRQRGVHVVNIETGGRDRTALLAEWLPKLANKQQTAPEPRPEPVKAGQAGPRSGTSTQPGEHVPNQPRSTTRGGAMDYNRGLAKLKECLEYHAPDALAEFSTLEEGFRKNTRDERLFGNSENVRNTRSQIIYALNDLALQRCGISFNELCQGADLPAAPLPSASADTTSQPARADPQPTQTPVSVPPTPTPPARPAVTITLQLAQLPGSSFEVRALESPQGQPRATPELPYTSEELVAVLKALQGGAFVPDRFTAPQTEALRRLGLLIDNHFAPNLLQRVGERLYQALLSGALKTAFQMALTQVRTTEGSIALQLRFDEEATELAGYPWELLHDGRRYLLPSQAIELTRYISYPEAPTRLSVRPPLRLLYLAPRPSDQAPLPANGDRIRRMLGQLQQENILQIAEPVTPTYDGLLDYLEDHDVHILHFDGHGTFARSCPRCIQHNDPHLTSCESCGAGLEDVAPQGYLAFDDGTSSTHWVSGDTLGHLLYGKRVRLAVLSACSSAAVRGSTLFGGVAPALIQAGVPAVVATQVPITDTAAAAFAYGFYRAVSRFQSIPAAVNAGRRRLFEGREWFIPVLYLRSQDDEGHLFDRS
jgi:CHAT domain-containing protein